MRLARTFRIYPMSVRSCSTLTIPKSRPLPIGGKKTSISAQPNHPPAGEIPRQPCLQTPKSSSRWRKYAAQIPLTRPNHPATGEIRPLNSPLHNQIIQSLEENTRRAIQHTTKSSSYRRNPYA